MILLFGGTSETYKLADVLSKNNFNVIVSTATNVQINLPKLIVHRFGRLDAQGIINLCQKAKVRIILDAGHPFAYELHHNCNTASIITGIPIIRFVRPKIQLPNDVILVSNHQEAAKQAYKFGGPVLVTIGTNNLQPYIIESRTTNLPIVARVLNNHESIVKCLNYGLNLNEFIAKRGPFCTQTNIELIKKYNIRAIVSKNSGNAGGLQNKIEAANLTNTKLIIIKLIDSSLSGNVINDYGEVVGKCLKYI